MSKIIVLIGVSASGKSTYANELVLKTKSKIVSRDIVRKKYFNQSVKGVLGFQEENKVTNLCRKLAGKYLSAGYDVIIDDTNLRTRYIDEWITFSVLLNHEIKIEIMPLLNKEIYVDRDNKREDSVGSLVIDKQYDLFKANFKEYEKRAANPLLYGNKKITIPKFVPFEVEPYVQNKTLPRAVWVDIDGTLAETTSRDIYDYSRVATDKCIEPVKVVVNLLADAGVKVVIMSGRENFCFNETKKWLDDNGIKYNEIHMRESNDDRPDDIVKYEMFNEFMRDNYNVIGAFDDRLRVSRLIIELGVKLFFVGDPDYEF